MTLSINNMAMPLIRYCTADIAVVGPERCACGRPYPLWERVEGRKQEYVVGPDGSLVALTGLIFGQHYRAFDRIKQMQIVQDRPGEIVVRLAVTSQWSGDDQSEFHQQMLRALGQTSWQIAYDYVDAIPLTARGKHRFVIQNLPLADTWAGQQD